MHVYNLLGNDLGAGEKVVNKGKKKKNPCLQLS